MAIVTLTSDLGNRDHYVAVIKANILSAIPGTDIVDITHQIKPHNISQAAYILKCAYKYFPAGTVHIISVDAGNPFEKAIALTYSNQYFIAPDNGLLSLVFESIPSDIVELENENASSVFVARDILVVAGIRLLRGEKLEQIGKPLQSINTKIQITPPVNADMIIASVIHIDHYGNIILNITRSQFESIVQERSFSVGYSRKDVFNVISTHYADVPEGERLILFNSENHLEIAVNKGNAHALLGIQLDARIQIEIK